MEIAFRHARIKRADHGFSIDSRRWLSEGVGSGGMK